MKGGAKQTRLAEIARNTAPMSLNLLAAGDEIQRQGAKANCNNATAAAAVALAAVANTWHCGWDSDAAQMNRSK